MFPFSPLIMAFALIVMLVAGFTLGIIAGFALTWIRKSSRRGLWKAGVAGMLAYVIVFIGMAYISAVTRSQNILINPALAALLAAIAAPALREWLRKPDQPV